MQTETHLDPNEGWGVDRGGEEWARLQSLLDLVRREHRTELSAERRAEIRDRVMERVARNERRRRRRRVWFTGLSAALAIWLVMKLFALVRDT
jgi:hypothetical protein